MAYNTDIKISSFYSRNTEFKSIIVTCSKTCRKLQELLVCDSNTRHFVWHSGKMGIVGIWHKTHWPVEIWLRRSYKRLMIGQFDSNIFWYFMARVSHSYSVATHGKIPSKGLRGGLFIIRIRMLTRCIFSLIVIIKKTFENITNRCAIYNSFLI